MPRRVVSIGRYTLKYEGGRLADIYMSTMYDPSVHCVDCTQVREYDFATGEFGDVPTLSDLRKSLREWIEADGQTYYENA